MDKNILADHIKAINQLSDEDKRYLYGECDKWCIENFEPPLLIVAILDKNNHENGIIHSFLINPTTEYCYDVRGESGSEEEILLYTGYDYNNDDIEEYIFDNTRDFKKFLKWIDFECIKENFLGWV